MKSTGMRLFLLMATVSGLSYAQPVITSVLDPYTGSTKLAPGGQAVITGTSLGIGPGVTVGGINAFTLVPPQASAQMTIEIPANAPVGSNVQVIVTTGAGASAPFTITLVQYAPILINVASGPLTSPRHNSSGVGVTSSTPAAAGESVVLYAIGLGPVATPVNVGALGPQGSSDLTTTTPTVTFNSNAVAGASARLANSEGFFGANASGGENGSGSALVAVFLVSFTVPAGTATGSYPVSVSIGGAASNSVMLSVGTPPTGPVISAIVGESGKTALCPGDIAIISGLNFGTSPTVTFGTKTAFTTQAPNGGNQMTVQIPVDAPLGSTNLTVALGSGQTSPAFAVTLTQYAPALVYGTANPLSPLHQNGAAVTTAYPAAPGETILLLAYGLGPTNPVAPTGTTPSSTASTVTTPTVNLGGGQATGVNAGLSSGQIGVYNVNFVVPPATQPGASSFAVSISVGGLTTGLTTLQVFNGPIIGNVSNAASNIMAGLPNAGIAQGSIFIAQGNGLGPANISVASTPFQSSALSNTSVAVTVSGTTVNALMYYTSANQIAALLPSSTPTGTGTITVTYNGTTGPASPISVVANNLGIFTIDSSGAGPGIVTFTDYSLVSASKAANCGGPNTTCGAANPGDTLIIWATGLGPVTGGDTAPSAVGQAINTPMTVWLGGVQAPLVFQGRGCCYGEDQIIITVPNNVPSGCAVPLLVQIGNEISNHTVMPVASGSRNCTPTNPALSAINVEQTVTAGPLSFGSVKLRHQSTGGSPPSFEDDAKFQFLEILTFNPGSQPFFSTWADDQPTGTCLVFNNLSGNGLNIPAASVNNLNAGSSFTIKGPNATLQVAGSPGEFDPTLSATGSFLVPGSYTVTGSGGADVGSFSATISFPSLPALVSPVNAGTFTRANGATVTWKGGSGNVQMTVSSATDNSFTNGAQAVCTAPASAGTFTIPPYILLALPAGPYGGFTFQPAQVSAPFTATGLSLGLIQTYSDDAGFGFGWGSGSFTLQ